MTSELPRASTGALGGTLPRAGTALPPRRRWAGLAIALVLLPLLTATLSTLRSELSLGTVLLLYLLIVVPTAAVGGVGPGFLVAAVSFLLANWFLVPPFHTLSVDRRDSIIELIVFAVVAGVVSATVHLAAREQSNAARSRLESQVLSRFTSEPVSPVTLDGVLDEVRSTFGMTSAALVQRDGAGAVVARVGPVESGRPSISVPASDTLLLVAHGPPTLFAEDRRFLSRLAANTARGRGSSSPSRPRAEELAALNRARSAQPLRLDQRSHEVVAHEHQQGGGYRMRPTAGVDACKVFKQPATVAQRDASGTAVEFVVVIHESPPGCRGRSRLRCSRGVARTLTFRITPGHSHG